MATPRIPLFEGSELRALLRDALRFWETRRVAYNLILTAVVVSWVALSWPHFRTALTFLNFLKLLTLGLLANVCYCAAYLVDIPMRSNFSGMSWQRWRPGLWVAGTLFAVLLTNYWIADEIYPFVN